MRRLGAVGLAVLQALCVADCCVVIIDARAAAVADNFDQRPVRNTALRMWWPVSGLWRSDFRTCAAVGVGTTPAMGAGTVRDLTVV